MSTFFWTFVSAICRVFLSLRYRIRVQGFEYLKPLYLNRKGGILFLPNHPALMDPLFLFLLLWPRFRMKPFVIEYIYRTPLLHSLMKLVGAISLPNFDTAVNEYKLKRASIAFQEIAKGLKEGENFVFYPAGRLKSTGKEVLGGASGLHSLLQECGDANIVLVRTTGLWGSKFSRAVEGRSPDLQKTLLYCGKAFVKSLFFFLPRRSVLIEIEPNPDLPTQDRLKLNQALENWYNQYPDEEGKIIRESEPLKLVSYSRWKRQVPTVQVKKQRHEEKSISVSSETQAKIIGAIQKILGRLDVKIEENMRLSTDLGMDSLNVAELIAFISKNFGVKEIHPEDFDTVRSVFYVAQGGKIFAEPRIGNVFSFAMHEKKRPPPVLPTGRTLPEAFLYSCQRMKSFIAAGDDRAGPVNYKKLKRSVLVLAEHFRTFKESHVAVLLPASIAAYVTIFALQMAKKVPVMLNWTLGPRYLEDMLRLSQAGRVLTSWQFIDRLPNAQFGSASERFVFLEDIRAQLTLKEKIRGAFLAKAPLTKIIKSLGLDEIHCEDPAVILFTSGTEASPKGVPLSHKNILSNLRSGMQCIEMKSQDVMYGILPPFHSFGFSVAGIFSFLVGVKIAFYPDPTDSFALAEGISRWKVTMFCSAPSFLKSLLHAALPEQLTSVRYFVCGAEKTPAELYKKVEKLGPHTRLLEGYGITECSPIISLNSPRLPPKGVGHLIPEVEMITIHPDTLEPQDPHQEGEICIRGPNVFKGYLSHPRDPFITLQGIRWYRTGDLGYLDLDDNIILSGRLKRFVKVGGEMISLAAVEEALLEGLRPAISDKPLLAICVKEREDSSSQLIVFTLFELTAQRANEILYDAGLSRLIKIADVRKIDEIPLMGSGKIDYRTLQAQIGI